MFVIDRFENDWAVIEYSRKLFNLPRVLLPRAAKVGDVITIDILVDLTATEELKQQNKTLIDDIFKE